MSALQSVASPQSYDVSATLVPVLQPHLQLPRIHLLATLLASDSGTDKSLMLGTRLVELALRM
jgi:hypothetical protein